MGTRNSRLGGFYQLNPFERLQAVKSFDGLNDEDLRQLHGGNGALTVERADKMIENVVGTFNLPLGVATNFQINGRDVLIPMVVEEPSIVAGVSFAATAATTKTTTIAGKKFDTNRHVCGQINAS